MDEATLRQNILLHAQEHIDDRVTENAGANRDSGNKIQRFFEVGAGWSQDHANHAWCAAFASYCVVSAFKEANLPLPVKKNGAPATKLHARCEDLKRMFSEVGRYLPLTEVQQGGARQPKPGDMVLFKEGGGLHAGLVYSYDPGSKKLVTVEGNNKPWKKNTSDPDLPDGVYTHEVRPQRFAIIDGFCVVAP